MFQVDIPDLGKIKITFKHAKPDMSKPPVSTTCTLTSAVTGHDILGATAHCSQKDQFCRERGRKLALTRAIQTFNKEQRTTVWQAYFAAKIKAARQFSNEPAANESVGKITHGIHI